MLRRWILPERPDPIAAGRLHRELRVPPFLAALLVNRGHALPESASGFLNPRLATLSAPNLLPGIEAAAERVQAAIDRGEPIVLYGDYDADGITSLALLQRVLTAAGAKVSSFLPHRVDEGYGLSAAGLERCIEEHAPALLVAVDCGTTSVTEIASLGTRGIDVVVLDHHEPGPVLPECAALVNPKCGDTFHYLCSAGVAFKLAHQLLRKRPVAGVDLKDYLDLVALGTIADIVPLVGENRVLARHGLRQLERSRWAGVAALIRVAGVTSPVRGVDVGFRLGPRINAAGRLGPAREALRLLLTDDTDEADRLAATLDAHNRERQTIERAVSRAADEWIDAHFDPSRDAAVVAGERDWHIGVLGVVASRVMRRLHRPALIVGFDADGNGKGSGRSIEGISLVELLRQCAPHLEKFGGHDMAAGLSVSENSFPAFREAFAAAAREVATEEILTPRLRLDAEVELFDLGTALLESQDLCEPFGAANAQPTLYTRALQPAGTPRVLKEKHLKIEFAVGRGRFPAMFFNASLEDLPRPPWDVAYTLDWNVWQGRAEPQMRIVDLRRAV